jgi:two-component system response regulator GlrR
MSQSNAEDRHLLLVDDNESLLQLMAIRLKGKGYKV